MFVKHCNLELHSQTLLRQKEDRQDSEIRFCTTGWKYTHKNRHKKQTQNMSSAIETLSRGGCSYAPWKSVLWSANSVFQIFVEGNGHQVIGIKDGNGPSPKATGQKPPKTLWWFGTVSEPSAKLISTNVTAAFMQKNTKILNTFKTELFQGRPWIFEPEM